MIKRYRTGYDEEQHEAEDGEHVMYTDHVAKVSELEAENKKHKSTIERIDATCDWHIMEGTKLEYKIKQLAADNDASYETLYDLQAKLDKAIAALEEINAEELNSQRPGGGYSRSATLSFNALAEIKETK